MNTTKYKATIYCTAEQDDYNDGLIGGVVNSWEEELFADTPTELRNMVIDHTYTKWEDIDDEQMNDYDWCTEYHASYLTNEDNQGVATKEEVEQWKQGRKKLYAIDCHILVTKITETKAELS